MKSTRDIVVVIIAVVTIIACVFVGYRLLNPKPTTTNQSPLANSDSKYVTNQTDEKTFKDLENLSRYPKPDLENIGKTDIFLAP